MVQLAEARQALADEWTAASPRTPGEIATFYRSSVNMRRDLQAWHATPERKALTEYIVSVAKHIGARRVLDVGAGIGTDLRAIRSALPGTECIAVEPNERMRVALIADGFAAPVDIEKADGLFDLIICVDVLEHLPAPDGLVRAMVDRLAPDGLLVERTATFDQDTPLHLAELAEWTPSATLTGLGLYEQERAEVTVWGRTQAAPTAIVCAYRQLSIETAESLRDLTDRGWLQAIHRGDALVTRVRSKAVSHWFNTTASDVFLMIDDDIVFKTEDAERVVAIAREKRSIACAAYPVRDGGHLACRALTPGEEIHFGAGVPPLEIKWPATGFMAVHRDVIAAMVRTMPLCEDNLSPWWPLFDTAFVRSDGEFLEDPTQAAGEQVVALSEDYAFGERARQIGFKVWLDPQAIPMHMAQTAYCVLNMPKAKVVQRGELS